MEFFQKYEVLEELGEVINFFFFLLVFYFYILFKPTSSEFFLIMLKNEFSYMIYIKYILKCHIKHNYFKLKKIYENFFFIMLTNYNFRKFNNFEFLIVKKHN